LYVVMMSVPVHQHCILDYAHTVSHEMGEHDSISGLESSASNSACSSRSI